MAAELGSAYFQLLPSLRGFSGAVSRELNGGGGIGREAGRTAGGLFTGAFSKALVPLAGIVAGAAGIGAITSFVSDSISSASDLQQSIGGVDAVFGKSAKQIHKWAQEGARSVGLSENSYNELASVIGSQLKNAGGNMATVSKQTKNLIGLGADLSATFGGTAAEAVEAISSALRGERDPIEKYGISLTQAAVDAQAAKLGFQKVGGALSTQATQAATLALLYKQSGAAAGQFQKQTNTLAEQQQILSASFENVKSKIGTAFLPVVTAVVGALSNGLSPLIDALGPSLDKLGKYFEDNSGKIGAAVQGITDILFKGDFTKAFSKAFGLQEDSPVVDFFFRVREGFLGIKTLLTGGGFSANLRTAFGIEEDSPIFTYLTTLKTAFSNILPLVGQVIQKMGPELGSAIVQIAPALAQVIPPLTTAVIKLFPSLLKIVLALIPVIPSIASIISSLAPVVSGLAEVLAFLITNGLQPLIQAQSGVVAFFNTLTQGGDAGAIALDALKGKFGPIGKAVTDFAIAIGTNFRNVRAAFDSGIQAAARLAAGIGASIGKAISFVVSLPNRARAALGNLGNALFGSGQALIGGFVRGIQSGIGSIGSAVSTAVQYAKDHFPNSPAKRGPLSGSGWRQINRSGIALADQWTSGFRTGVRDFGAEMGNLVPDALAGSINARVATALPSSAGERPVLTDHGTLFGMIQTAADGTARLLLNREAAVDSTTVRLGYQPLVFG